LPISLARLQMLVFVGYKTCYLDLILVAAEPCLANAFVVRFFFDQKSGAFSIFHLS
jgi:hypothetical protein